MLARALLETDERDILPASIELRFKSWCLEDIRCNFLVIFSSSNFASTLLHNELTALSRESVELNIVMQEGKEDGKRRERKEKEKRPNENISVMKR